MTTVGVLGLGKLGLPYALVLAEAGHRTLVWDVDERALEAVRTRTPHIDEPLVTEMLQECKLEIAQPTFIAEIADVVFVVVPTPSLGDGSFDAKLVGRAVDSLKDHRGAGPVVTLISTVSPGTCRKLSARAQRCGLSFVYTPTMIALGSVVRDLRDAELQIFGWNDTYEDQAAAARVRAVMRTVAPNTPTVDMSYESAEICKIASNVFSTLKITFANQLAQLCDTHLGADVNDVVEGLKLRSHIGPKLITPGAGFGGPCFPRDTWAAYAAGLLMGETIQEWNDEHVRYVCSRLINTYANTHDDRRAKSFTVLGRNYKEGSNYRIESFGDQVHDHFIHSYRLKPTNGHDADLVLIAMPLRGVDLCSEVRDGAVVLDLWRTHGYLAECPVTYLAFGVPR